MNKIHVDTIIPVIKDLCINANCNLRDDTLCAFKRALNTEKSPLGKEVLQQLIKNEKVARTHQVPFCQDTGYAVLFVDIGQGVQIIGGSITEAINEGVKQGYTKGFLRKSIVKNPIQRVNTGDNTPAIINYDIVEGNTIKISLLVKGCGCDNMSRIKMFTPAEGLEAAMKFIIDTVDQAGPNASPPMVVGVGMGGPFARAALLAQKALLWPIDKPNPDPKFAEIEQELFTKLNQLGIGPAGYGGSNTILGIHIEPGAAHIASFPVAVNIDCHSHRGKEAIIQ